MLKKIEKIGRFKLWEAQRDYLWKKHSLDYLFWECTLTCNFSCKHCGSRAEKHAYQGELTTEEIKKVFREVAHDFDAKKITIAVTGGEPLLRKDLFEVMKYAKELGFSWGMVTNGFLIDENIIGKMKEAGMESIDISIDGIGEFESNVSI